MNKNHGAQAIKKDKEQTFFSVIAKIMFSLGISIAMFLVLILVFALYCASQDDPRKYMLVLGVVCAVLGALAGGFTVSWIFSESIAVSVILGVMYALTFLILRLVFAANEPFEGLCVSAFYPGLIGASLIGSIIGRYRPNAVKSRKKRIKKFTH